LLSLWLEDSWPVGAIAAYISARSSLFDSSDLEDGAFVQQLRRWPGVRDKLLGALSDLTSTQIVALTGRPASEHFPYWHPIADLPILRLHSTLGCLELVGAQFRQDNQRINDLVRKLREHLKGCKGQPRFEPESCPSVAAASALLGIVLGPWYEPVEEDLELLDNSMSFLEDHWMDPAAYEDYWSEFAAPLLGLSEILRGLENSTTCKKVETLLAMDVGLGGQEVRPATDIMHTFSAIIPTALGLERVDLQ
jgi:hypothetical protein